MRGHAMHEEQGDIWRYTGSAVIVLTTNGSLTSSWQAVPGYGVTRQAIERYPWIAAKLGLLIKVHGNHVFDLGGLLASFPVEETAWSQPDPKIIARSAEELRCVADTAGWQKVIVPRPGCGGGGLRWFDVQPLLEPWFDSRFTVIHRKILDGDAYL